MERCLDRFGGLVWSLVRRLGGSSGADAEDTVQEIFLDVWKNAHRYDSSIASETAFVAMITRRRIIDRRRRQTRRPVEQELVEGSGAVDSGVAATRGAELGDEAAKAGEALGRLTEAQQRVLKLAIYHGLSHEKISKATGLPLGTVKTHARRGLMKVRELLSQTEQQAGMAPGGGA
ncbi:MAG: sigma-70 family RNA polymerase sigma factor [Planctomycetota bacterium]